MKVLAFVLDSIGLTDVFDLQEVKYGNPQLTAHTFVMVEDNHPEIGKKLFVQEVFQQEDIVAAINGKPTTPPVPNDTTFVSAEVPYTSGGWHVDVTLSDDKGYASVSAEWELTINGTKRADIFVTGKNTNLFQLRFKAGTDQAKLIKAGDTVMVTHKIADSGIKQFTDKTVTNSLQAAPPPPVNDESDQSDEPDQPKKKKKKKRSKLKYNTKDTAAKE